MSKLPRIASRWARVSRSDDSSMEAPSARRVISSSCSSPDETGRRADKQRNQDEMKILDLLRSVTGLARKLCGSLELLDCARRLASPEPEHARDAQSTAEAGSVVELLEDADRWFELALSPSHDWSPDRCATGRRRARRRHRRPPLARRQPWRPRPPPTTQRAHAPIRRPRPALARETAAAAAAVDPRRTAELPRARAGGRPPACHHARRLDDPNRQGVSAACVASSWPRSFAVPSCTRYP